MPDTPTIPPNTYDAQWAQWPMSALERIRLPYPWIVVLMASLGAASVALDTALRYHLHGVWPARDVAVGVSSVVVSVYILIYMRIIRRTSGRALAQLRPSVQISNEEYESYVRRFLHTRGSVESMLICLALLLVIFFLVLPPDQLRGLTAHDADRFAAVAVITLYWTVLFYLLLSLVYISIRNAARAGRAGEAAAGDQRVRSGRTAASRQAQPGSEPGLRGRIPHPASHYRPPVTPRRRLVRDWAIGAGCAGGLCAVVGGASTDLEGARPRPGEHLRRSAGRSSRSCSKAAARRPNNCRRYPSEAKSFFSSASKS